MRGSVVMSDQAPKTFAEEAREIVIKSGLTGVAATVLAVTAFSPAGFGGMIGTSLASGFGVDTNARVDENIYANLPAYPSPLTTEEVSTIQSQLARSTASLEITRAATEAKIEHIRTISLSDAVASFAPAPVIVEASVAPPVLRGPTVEAPVVAQTTDPSIELAELMFAHENL
jgi:hypothetical protein